MNKHEAPKALLQDQINPVARTLLEEQGLEVETFPKGLQPDELAERGADADMIGVRSEGLKPEVVEQLPQLKLIAAFCIGTDKIDIQLANERNIAVVKATTQTAEDVAELAILQTGNLFRRLAVQNAMLHAGNWNKHTKGERMAGKIAGILGYGAIGQLYGQRAEAFGMRPRFFDITDRTPVGSAEAFDREQLLREADVLSVHVPGGQGRPALTAEDMRLMKPTAFVINTARADSVDYEALDYATRNGDLAGAALDVFPDEPKSNKEEFSSIFRGNDKVIMTSHLGGSTPQGQAAIARFVSVRAADFLREGDTSGVYNAHALAESIAA